MNQQERNEVIDEFGTFLRRYYKEKIGELAEQFPNESTSLVIDWMDVYRFDDEKADDYLNAYEEFHECMEIALGEYDLPIDIDLSKASVRLTGLPETDVYEPSDLRSEHSGSYIGIDGVLDRVTTPSEKPIELTFECQRCGTWTMMQQDSSYQEPYECQGCERQGPFKIADGEGEWTDYCKVRIQTPADRGDADTDGHIDGYVEGELVDYGHRAGLLGRVGEPVTVYGMVERKQKQGRGENEMLFDRVFRVEAVEFDTDEDSVDIEAHRHVFEEMAEEPDAVDKFAESLVPQLFATPEWEHALELGVAYLFAAPRIDVPNGPSYRGDIHGMIISGYGMGKSMFNRALKAYSPDAIMKSATALSSDVGLLAAAVKDDFGEGQWTIKPGILVRGNGGHVILDEIDKTGADLARMNDALEGSQTVDVEKAGQSVTYKSRIGLFATGNPKEGRFNDHESIAEQIDAKPELLSRFDGIVTMKDREDIDRDAKIAETIGNSYAEAQEAQFGDREEFDELDRPVPIDVGRAWVAEARQNYAPLISRDQIGDIKEWYANELRQLNQKFASKEGIGADMPVPVNARVVEGTIRFSVAFARCHLRNEVTNQDVKRAKSLMKSLVGQTFDEEGFTPMEVRGSQQKDEWEQLEPKILEALPDDGNPMFPSQIANDVNEDEGRVSDKLKDLKTKGRVSGDKGKYWME